ncbi:MAG: DNA primase [bacterium]
MLEITDEIKSRLDIAEVIREYIKLNPAGTNFKALCPFHNETTPSFMVSSEKQIWHCFGCGEGGDIFGFVMKMENIEFIDALRLLAKKAGVRLTRQDPKLASLRGRLTEIMNEAIEFYQYNLWQAPLGQFARDYLNQRKISKDSAQEFKLGFAPASWDSLINFLKKRGFQDQDILAAGLIIKKDSGAGFYDRFRNRLIFPIFDVHNQPVGLGGRTLAFGGDEEKTAKYINTPQTLIYNKSQAIYGLDKAKLEIRKKELIIIVEGYLDVISSHQVDIKNVVATSGTALTAEHLKILKRYSQNLALAFDADLGGDSARSRGLDLALAHGLNVKLILIPQGKDPDECIKLDPKLWQQSVAQPLNFLDYYFEKTFANLDLSKAENKKKAAKILLPLINKIADKIEQNHYLKKLAEILGVPEQILHESLSAPAAERGRPTFQPVRGERHHLLSERILSLALKYGLNLDYLINNLTPTMLADDTARKIYNNLIIYYTNSNVKDFSFNFDYPEFRNLLAEEDSSLTAYADQLVLLAEKDFFDFSQDLIRKEILEDVKSLKKDYFKSELKKIEEKIKQAEKIKNNNEIEKLFEQFNQLTKQLALVS